MLFAHQSSFILFSFPKDCYVAVAGLPVQRNDHAVILARFAMECQDAFRDIASKLQISLGPDTGESTFRALCHCEVMNLAHPKNTSADLSLRMGLHSGSVTAGVLRGDNARFQL